MNFEQIVNESQIKMKDTIYLLDQLYSIDSSNVESVKQYILSSNFISNRRSLSILLRSIDGAFEARPLSFSFYLDIIKAISDPIRTHFSSFELFCDLIHNNYLRFNFYELGFIDLSTVLFYLKRVEIDLQLFFIFAFEVKSHDSYLYSSYACQSKEFRDYLARITHDEHSILRTKGLNQQKVALLIRANDAQGFQEYQFNTNLDLNSKIVSNYENYQYSEMNLSLIEYSALFGALDVFKYLLMKGASISENLPVYAVTGGNYEIIHILEKNGSKFNNEMSLNNAIKYHRNEIVDYIKESLNVDYSIVSLKTSLEFYNLEKFFEICETFTSMPNFVNRFDKEDGNILTFSVKCGYVDIVEAFSILIQNPEKKKKLIQSALDNRRFDTFEFLYSSLINDDKVQPDNNKLFLSSAFCGNMTIFKFLMPFVTKNYFEIIDLVKCSILHLAASFGDADNFKFIVSLKPTIDQLNQRDSFGISFLLILYSTFNCR